jgi:hypothetical protein
MTLAQAAEKLSSSYYLGRANASKAIGAVESSNPAKTRPGLILRLFAGSPAAM